MRLETRHAEKIISLLEDAQDVGLPHVVFELRPADLDLQPHQLSLFETIGEALDYLDDVSGNNHLPGDADYPVYYRHADQLLEELKLSNPLTINKIAMNLNNLENLREEMKELRFDKKLSDQMEEMMKKNVPDFQLKTSIPGNKGMADFTLHFKQSGQSEFYYLGKYDVLLNKSKPLEGEQKYLVIMGRDQDKPGFRKFDSPYEAIPFFKGLKGENELALGKDIAHKETLAKMENDKVIYIAKDFNKIYREAPVQTTFYVDRGKGFTADQAANMIEGRSVYRDDLLNVGGVPYKAYVALDMDKPKDRNDNFVTRQYNDPAYGFNLEKTLDKYQIKELEDPAKRELLLNELKNGGRPLITTMQEGKVVKLHIEAMPRYSQINFTAPNGKPEKREQFEKAVEKNETLSFSKGKNEEVKEEQNKGMRV
jgi:hypothetical protein